jgi:hypothetical protein
MPERAPRRAKITAIARAAIGPPALVFVAATQGLRVTGPLTVSLTHPSPAWALVVSDVLSVLALATLALWAASVLAGRPAPVLGFMLPVAASQLPMAAAALICGRTILGRIVSRVLAGSGESLLANPRAAFTPFVPAMVGLLLLTALAAGVMYVGYRRATKMAGYRLALSFVGGLVGAEILCRAWFVLAG